MWSRRETLLGALALSACAPAGRIESYTPPPNDPRFAEIEARIGGRVGVFALDLGTGAALAHRAHERFALCSTFKWLLAAQILQMAERQPDFLNQRVLFVERDLLSYAPVARERFGDGPRGEMTVEELAEAAIVLSDNTAANLLLEGVGGPGGLTGFLRANGDAVTRLDRTEIELNDVAPGDERDTTTPDAMAHTMARLLLGRTAHGAPPLNAASREKLIGWMVASPTGRERLRAGFPASWRVGDKTGTWAGEHNATNDVAIAFPPSRAPIIIACYLAASSVEPAARNAAHAEVARAVVETWS
jgi:beta-lactamase class A